jgi:hypothetical protein
MSRAAVLGRECRHVRAMPAVESRFRASVLLAGIDYVLAGCAGVGLRPSRASASLASPRSRTRGNGERCSTC